MINRAFESKALRLLLNWAAKNLEKSINQPTLPAAIIVFNSTSLNVDPSEWDVEKATRSLMEVIKDDVRKNERLKALADYWKEHKKVTLETTEKLIKRYYSSVAVVRIPEKGRYPRLQSQVTRLRNEIIKACAQSHQAKQKARMLANVEEMGFYLKAGFDHFSTKLDDPFNFMDVSVRKNPIPEDASDHILNLAVNASQDTKPRDAPRAFEELSPFLASCFQLEYVRRERIGINQRHCLMIQH